MTRNAEKSIVLFGYGKFGRAMYRQLKAEGFHIRMATMNEVNYEAARRDEIADVRRFNPKHNDSIRALGIDEKRHLLYCVMDHTANNLFLVLSLRELYHNASIIAISNSEENTRKLRFAGADTIINIYDASAQHIISALSKPAVHEAIGAIVYGRNGLRIAEVELPEGTPLHGKKVGEIDFRAYGLILIAIIDRELGERLIYLSKGIDHVLDGGDMLVLAGTGEAIEHFRRDAVDPTT